DDLVYQIVNDMMGLGPLEPLLEDEGVTDIMINGPKQIYIEKRGKLELTSVTFEDNAHLLNICNRIVSRVGRRVDEASPICDARPAARRRSQPRPPPPACPTPPASTSSSRRSPSTARRSRSESSASDRSASIRWRSRATSRQPWRPCCASPRAAGSTSSSRAA